jgi:hypothetical protein
VFYKPPGSNELDKVHKLVCALNDCWLTSCIYKLQVWDIIVFFAKI